MLEVKSEIWKLFLALLIAGALILVGYGLLWRFKIIDWEFFEAQLYHSISMTVGAFVYATILHFWINKSEKEFSPKDAFK